MIQDKRLTAICGSDLHLYGGLYPQPCARAIFSAMSSWARWWRRGREVSNSEERRPRGGAVHHLLAASATTARRGSVVAVRQQQPRCAKSWAKACTGYAGGGLFGYSHLYGGYRRRTGAVCARALMQTSGRSRCPTGCATRKCSILSDIFPTGYMAAENCNIQPGDTIAVWGCGPVGQFAVRSAFLLGADAVIAIDRVPERLELAKKGGAEVVNLTEDKDVVERLKQLTSGRGPDACVDAVGVEAHGTGLPALYDNVKFALKMETDRPTACVRQYKRAAQEEAFPYQEFMADLQIRSTWALHLRRA